TLPALAHWRAAVRLCSPLEELALAAKLLIKAMYVSSFPLSCSRRETKIEGRVSKCGRKSPVASLFKISFPELDHLVLHIGGHYVRDGPRVFFAVNCPGVNRMLRVVILIFLLCFISDACRASEAENQANAFAKIYTSLCLQHLTNLDGLRAKLKDM